MPDAIIAAKLSQYQKLREEICNIESPTACKEGVDAMGCHMDTVQSRWQPL